jgi:dTDP-4-dehydrorhamnose reductase
LARAAKNCNAQFVSISTDHLWDGRDLLTNENKPPQPLNAYARTKYLGEVKALGANSNSLIIRTNFFGPGRPWRSSFSDWIINSLQSKQSITTFTDSHFTPIGLSHLCPLLHQLVERSASGIFNLAGRERISKFDFSIRLAVFLGLDRNLIQPGTVEDANLVAQRPKDMSLSVDKIEKFLNLKMPNLDESFASLLQKPHGRNNL